MTKFTLYYKTTEIPEDVTVATLVVDDKHYYLVTDAGKYILYNKETGKEIPVVITNCSPVEIHIMMNTFHERIQNGLI